MPERGGEIWLWNISEEEFFFREQLDHATVNEITPLTSAQRRLQILASRYLLKLAGREDKIIYHANGKPEIRSGYISISHTGNMVAIYLSSKPAGLDIEQQLPRVLRIAERFLNENEKKRFGTSDIEVITLIWSAKEALFKKHGGETIHFAANIEVHEINSDRQIISVKLKNSGIWQEEELSYQKIDNNVIVYTR